MKKQFIKYFVKPLMRWTKLNESLTVPKDQLPTKESKNSPTGEVVQNLSLQNWVNHFKTILDPSQLVKQVTFLPEGMMTKAGVTEYDDPVLGKVANARIQGMSWLVADEKGKLKSKNLGYNSEMRESWNSQMTALETRKTEMRESYAEKMVKEGWSRESLPVNPSFDLTDVADWSQLGTPNNGITRNMPFPPGPFSKQMYLQDFWKMNSLAFQFYNYSGLAKRVIDVKKDFILGNGIKVDFLDDDNLQTGWDRFEDENGWYITLSRWIISLHKYGELFVQPLVKTLDKPIQAPKKKVKVQTDEDQTATSEPVTNSITVRSVDNSTIWDYVTNPEDIYEIYGYWVQFTTQYQLYTKGTEGPEQKYTEYIMRMMPPDSLIHIKINCDENEKRGRSDLLPALPYFAYNDDYLRALVQRAIMEASYVWDIEVQTGDDSDVSREAGKESNFPTPGSSYFHNSAVKRTLVGFQGAAGATGSNSRGEEIIQQISIATGIPKEFLGYAGQSNKAAALTATAPLTKHIQSCQKEIEVLVRKMVRFYCEANGRPDAKFEVIFPEIAPADMLQKIQALVLAETSGFYSKSRAATMVAKEFNDTTYDYEIEKKLIDVQNQQDKADMQTQMALYGQPHAQAPGQPGQHGQVQGPQPPKIPGAGILPGVGVGSGTPSEKVIGPSGGEDSLGGTGLGG